MLANIVMTHIPAMPEFLFAPPRMVLFAGVARGFEDWTPPLILILFVFIPLLILMLSTSPAYYPPAIGSPELTFGRLFKTSIPPFFWMKAERVLNLCLKSATCSRVILRSWSRVLFFCWLRLYFLSRIAKSFFICSLFVDKWWYIILSWSRFFSLFINLLSVF